MPCSQLDKMWIEMKLRTFRFGLATIRLAESLPKSVATKTLGNQLLRSGTSVGANYRAACRARSRADFVSKMKIAEEECDEALYWLNILIGSGILKSEDVSKLEKEGNELLSIIVASIKTARQHSNRQS
jgi:four helix bundle protein